MSNILEFPSREKQAYAYLTDQLGSLLRDKGADDVLIAHATELLTKVYGDLQGDSDFSFSVSLPNGCLLYTSPSPRDRTRSPMPSSA